MLETKTKIICTIGPATDSLEQILKLVEAGMNVARINFSHGTHPWHAKIIQHLKKAREMTKQPLAIMADTKGPEIRISHLFNSTIQFQQGKQFLLTNQKSLQSEDEIVIHPLEILNSLKKGMQILFSEGLVNAQVIRKTTNGVLIQMENSGTITIGKGVNIPEASINLPAVTEQDIDDIKFACQQDVDLIAASFIRSADHIATIRKLLEHEKKSDILVIAKIENKAGIDNFNEILQAADGIMIARGDLGVEYPLSQVPKLQKKMIYQCHLAGKPSITATQMLESMIQQPRPTRAEASDVANAIYDSTTAVMLSGETAAGKYPIEAVQIMKSIIFETEKDFDYNKFYQNYLKQTSFKGVPHSIAQAAVKTANALSAKVIMVMTCSGRTAHLIANLRPSMHIMVLTANKKAYHQLAFQWGMKPVLYKSSCEIRDVSPLAEKIAISKHYGKKGDFIVIVTGTADSQLTNMMFVKTIGKEGKK